MIALLRTTAFALCMLPAASFASEGNQAVEACKTLGRGDTCVLKEPTKGPEGVTYREIDGTCQTDECCEQDYSKGSPPEVTCSECLACKPGATPTVSAEPNAGGEPPRAGDDPPTSAGSQRGCTLGGSGWGAALWMFAPLAGLSLWGRRR